MYVASRLRSCGNARSTALDRLVFPLLKYHTLNYNLSNECSSYTSCYPPSSPRSSQAWLPYCLRSSRQSLRYGARNATEGNDLSPGTQALDVFKVPSAKVYQKISVTTSRPGRAHAADQYLLPCNVVFCPPHRVPPARSLPPRLVILRNC